MSSWEFNKRIEEPLFGIFVGVVSLGESEYDGGAAEYPGGPPVGVEGRFMLAGGFCEGMRLRNWRVDALKPSMLTPFPAEVLSEDHRMGGPYTNRETRHLGQPSCDSGS